MKILFGNKVTSRLINKNSKFVIHLTEFIGVYNLILDLFQEKSQYISITSELMIVFFFNLTK